MELFVFDRVLYHQYQTTTGVKERALQVKQAGFHSSIHPGIFLSIQSVNIAATWNRIKAAFFQSWSITTISSVIGFGVLRGRLFLPLTCTLCHTHTRAHTFMHTTAAALFLVQSLALLAKGTSNHNCKLIVCPHWWLQHLSYPRLNTSLSSVIAAIVIHSTTKEQLWKKLKRPSGLK